jgi:hypothetical protein
MIARLLAACLVICALATQASAAATLLPPAEQCFEATTATSGGQAGIITALGSITAGTGYVNGTYTNVSLTGGSGSGAKATVVVSGTGVTSVVPSSFGIHYVASDVLSANNASLGGSGSGFSVPVSAIQGSGTGMIGVLGSLTGGSGGTTGTYPNVALTGGFGTNATATITVAGGAVTQVTVLNPGAAYVVGDTLSAASGSIGNVTGFSVVVNSVAINQALAGGQVFFYIPGTQTFKQTWFNADQSANHQNTNPVPLDANGCAIIYGTGSYRQILQDSLGNTVWDQITTDTSANNSYFWAGLAGGTPNVITVTDPGFNATDGTEVAFTAIATNTGAATINGIPVEKDTTGGPVSLVGGEIVQNNPVIVVYRTADNAFHITNPPIQSASGSIAPLCGTIGLRLVNDSGSPNSEIDATVTQAVMVAPTGASINRTGLSFTINAGTVGANGIDIGSLAASTVYYVFLIDNGSAPAGLISTSAISPILPSGYSYVCRVAAWETNTSAQFLKLATLGNITTATVNNLSTGTTAGFFLSTATQGTCATNLVNVTFGGIPPTANRALVNIAVASTNEIIMNYATGTSTVVQIAGANGVSGFLTGSVIVQLPTPQVLTYCNNSTGNTVYVYGWVDAVNAN